MGTDPSKGLDQGGMLGDLWVIFLTAESAPSAARFRPYRNLVNPVNPVSSCKHAENSSER